jgi:uncharacterized MAPEG superfamily protein
MPRTKKCLKELNIWIPFDDFLWSINVPIMLPLIVKAEKTKQKTKKKQQQKSQKKRGQSGVVIRRTDNAMANAKRNGIPQTTTM